MIFNQEQKKIIGKFFVSILALLLIIMCYSYAIPRTEVEIDTVYHSSYSALFVQSKMFLILICPQNIQWEETQSDSALSLIIQTYS